MSQASDEARPGWALMTVDLSAAAPTLANAAKVLGVPEMALDERFGVMPLDPERHLYAVQVRADCLPARQDEKFRGPFAVPRIEPF